MKRTIALLVLYMLLGAMFIATSLNREVMDIGLRANGFNTPGGWTLRDYPPGQLIECDFADLSRIDVRVIRQGPNDDPLAKLELRRVSADRVASFLDEPVIRTVVATADDSTSNQRWLRFEFDPVADSRGSIFHFCLRAADDGPKSEWAPFVCMRSSRGVKHQWGPRVEGYPIFWDFRPTSADLSSIAIAFGNLHPTDELPWIDLYRLPEEVIEGKPPIPPEHTVAEPQWIARGMLGHDMPITAGYGFFLLEPPVELRYVPMRAVLNLPPGAVVAGKDNVPGAAAFHGLGEPVKGLLGQTLGNERMLHRDLDFRAYGEDGIEANWRLVKERGAAPRYVLALLFWVLAMTLATTLMLRFRPQSSDLNQT